MKSCSGVVESFPRAAVGVDRLCSGEGSMIL